MYVIGRINKKKDTKKSEFDKEKTNRRAISTVNGCLVADKLSFLSLEVRSCDIVHVTAVEQKDCLRATDHVPTSYVLSFKQDVKLVCTPCVPCSAMPTPREFYWWMHPMPSTL